MTTKAAFIDIEDGLIEGFRESERETKEDIVRRSWRSIVCMSCGACCCSDVIPIKRDDFNDFHGRLGLGVGQEDFAEKFLQNSDILADNCAIETKRHGGRCMFLDKEENGFSCGKWDIRPDVCREYFCWEMTNFEKYQNGEEQDLFDPSAQWKDNFALLLFKVINESSLSVFPEEMVSWLKLRAGGLNPGYYKTLLKKL